MPSATVSERQKKWFVSLREGLERDTGKSLDDWVKVARQCPEAKPRARQKWLKDNYGIGQNRAIMIFDEAFGDSLGWDKPDQLLGALWKDETNRKIYDRIAAAATKLEGVTVGVRKTFVGFSRKVQFAAAKPVKDGVRVGFAVAPSTNKRLDPAKKSEGWSDRCKAAVVLTKPTQVDADLKRLLKTAWEQS